MKNEFLSKYMTSNKKFQLNHLVLCILFLTVISSCYNPKSKDIIEKEQISEIDSLISKWHKDASEYKLNDYLNAMSQNCVYLGTDASEYWTKEKFANFCKPYFDKKNTWDFHLVNRNIYIGNDSKIAWFDELLDTKLGLCRGSGVLQKINSKWQIEQYVLSPTLPNELTKVVVEMKRETDSLTIEKYKLH